MAARCCTYHPRSVSRAPEPPSAALPGMLAGLLRPQAYPHSVAGIELVQTHMSWILLTGSLAYKIKRPVRFAFADFSDGAHRAWLCEEEVRLNRRFAPALYLGVAPIRRDAHGLASFAGDGPAIETAVQMRQFDRRDELDALVAAGRVEPAELRRFGATLASIHATLGPPPAGSAHGRAPAVARVLRRNFAEWSAGTRQAVARAPLRHALAGYWSRRITDEHRFVYKPTGNQLLIAQLRYHYE